MQSKITRACALVSKFSKKIKRVLTTGYYFGIITTLHGALAQLGAHNTGSVGVRGSNPLCSTKNLVLRNEIFLSIAEAMAYHQTEGLDIITVGEYHQPQAALFSAMVVIYFIKYAGKDKE